VNVRDIVGVVVDVNVIELECDDVAVGVDVHVEVNDSVGDCDDIAVAE
jgi:hypothetical protein